MEQQPQNNPQPAKKQKLPIFGVILIVLGVIFLLQKAFNIDILGQLPWDYIWPTVIILLGIHIIYKKTNK